MTSHTWHSEINKQEPVARTHHTTSSKKTTCLVFIIVMLCVIIGLEFSMYGSSKMNRQNKCSFSCQQWRNVMRCLWLEGRRDGVIVASLQQTQRQSGLLASLHTLLIVPPPQGQTVKRLSLFWKACDPCCLIRLILHTPVPSLIPVPFVSFSPFNVST